MVLNEGVEHLADMREFIDYFLMLGGGERGQDFGCKKMMIIGSLAEPEKVSRRPASSALLLLPQPSAIVAEIDDAARGIWLVSP